MALSETLSETAILCKQCGNKKELSNFHIRKDIKCGHLSTCKKCVNSARRKKLQDPIYKERVRQKKARHYQKNKEKYYKSHRDWVNRNLGRVKAYYLEYNKLHRERRRNQALQAMYGISLIDYNEMFIIQNGRCAICEKHQVEFKKRFHVDHNHKTGEVRGLLCCKCNRAIGLLCDDIAILEKAILYLGEQ